MAIVTANDVKLSIRETAILETMSFAVEKGEFVSFIGPSGCGKTTLLNVIAGIRSGYSGRLEVGTDRISFVFQHDSLLEWQTVLDNVLLPFTLKRIDTTDALRDRALGLLGLVGLEGHTDYFPHQLSGGMKKRVELARAIVTEPELLILDEPFSSLDIITRERLNLLVKRIHSLHHTTVILVTHSVEEACFLSNRIYVLSPLPARIVEIKHIPGSPAARSPESNHLYVLSPEQQAVNGTIRKEAKYLWDLDAPPAYAVKGENDIPAVRFSPGKWQAGRAKDWLRRHWSSLLIPAELALLYLALSKLKTFFDVPDLLFPAPGAVAEKFFATLIDGTVLRDLSLTVAESLLGFVIAFAVSMIVGFVIAKSGTASRLFMPYFIGANTIPSVALAPFLVLWFGFGLLPRVITSVIVIFFPLLINVIAAFRHSEERVRHLIRFYKPGRLQSLLAMEFPAALPGIFSGIKISITLSVIGAVVGEFVSGHEGLGALVSRSKANFDVELMFVGLLWLIGLGLAYYGMASGCYRLIRKRLTTPRVRRKRDIQTKEGTRHENPFPGF